MEPYTVHQEARESHLDHGWAQHAANLTKYDTDHSQLWRIVLICSQTREPNYISLDIFACPNY